MAQRNMLKKSGANVNTILEVMFRSGSRSYSGGGGTQSAKMPFDFITSDYIADTTRADCNFRIDCYHWLGHQNYLWKMFKIEDGGFLEIIDYWNGKDVLSLWFRADTKSIRVVIDP